MPPLRTFVSSKSHIVIIGVICLTLTVDAVWIDNNYINLPFGILTGLSVLIFYYCGWVVRLVDGFRRLNLFAELRVILDIPFGWQQILFDYLVIGLSLPFLSKISTVRNIFGVKEIRLIRANLWR